MMKFYYQLRMLLAKGLLLSLPGYMVGSRGFAAPAATGAVTYKAKCAMCHGPDGSGDTPMGKRFKLRDLRSPEVQKETDEDLTEIITNGKPPMPGYGKSLRPAQIHDLIAYIRSVAKS
ncbi:MAG TPA: cytochrome c [Bryobacteraceae bacterium]|jgi:mono/diheme cytochrome c family protein|nr:cytochrome c [Bryobacteraceae bacterium]